MLYSIAQTIRHKIPFIWQTIEIANETLFRARYGNRLKVCMRQKTFDVEGIQYSFLTDPSEAVNLKNFFDRQPEESFQFFNPHKFDLKTSRAKLKSHAFITLCAFDGDKLVGYSFLRSFFNGKAFRGKLVDHNYRGRGIAKNMCKILTEVCYKTGLRQYESVSKNNLASLNSTKAINDIIILEELENEDLLIECKPKGNPEFIH